MMSWSSIGATIVANLDTSHQVARVDTLTQEAWTLAKSVQHLAREVTTEAEEFVSVVLEKTSGSVYQAEDEESNKEQLLHLLSVRSQDYAKEPPITAELKVVGCLVSMEVDTGAATRPPIMLNFLPISLVSKSHVLYLLVSCLCLLVS